MPQGLKIWGRGREVRAESKSGGHTPLLPHRFRHPWTNLILAIPLNGNRRKILAKKVTYLNIQIFSRYDPPSSMEMETSIIAKSLADEIKEEQINGSDDDGKPEPPPDLLVSSNCRRKIWPQFDIIDNCNDSENHHSAQRSDLPDFPLVDTL